MARYYHWALETEGVQVLSVGPGGSWFEHAVADRHGPFASLKPLSPIDPRQGWALARVAKAFAPDIVLAHGSRGAGLPVAVVANFAPLRPIPPHGTIADPPRIGSLGRLHAEKGFDILLEAAARLRDRGRAFRLTIAGEGPAAADLKALSARLGLTTQVDFPGWVSPPDRLLAELDLFVCSSRTESFGLVVIEAMAAGAPVIATDIEGPRILLAGGRYGRLVPPEAPDALAQAMAAALDDPKASLEMARLAQAEAIAPYDMDAGGMRLWTALMPLLEGR